ncbi:hypothetical protein MKX01_016364, partial [Papaver californicum]
MQLDLFSNAGGMFGYDMAKETQNTLWKSYGDSAPELQRVDVCILSATCSSTGYEKNWSIFEQVHTKKRNSLSRQRLNVLVYKEDFLLQGDPSWTDVYDCFQLTEEESVKKKRKS